MIKENIQPSRHSVMRYAERVMKVKKPKKYLSCSKNYQTTKNRLLHNFSAAEYLAEGYLGSNNDQSKYYLKGKYLYVVKEDRIITVIDTFDRG